VEKLSQLILLCVLLSSCSHLVKVSYSPEAVIHPAFDQPFCTWNGERVKVVVTPSLRREPLKYLLKYDQVILANSIRQRGLRHEYKIAGKGTPLVVYAKNPEISPQEKLSIDRYYSRLNRGQGRAPGSGTATQAL
jgi:hypothetical protein